MQTKDFLKFVVAVAAMGSLIIYFESCQKSSTGFTDPSEDFTVDLSSPANGALLTVGGYIVSNNVVIINLGNGTYAAISDLCTYDGCALNYNTSTVQFTCPCHGDVFNQGGVLVTGPATTSLKTYVVTQNINLLHIHG